MCSAKRLKLLETDCRAMWVSTFHALCARLLRREAHNIGLSRDFTIYDSADQQAVIKQLLKEYHLADETYQPRMVLSRISPAKNRMEGPRASPTPGTSGTRRSASCSRATSRR